MVDRSNVKITVMKKLGIKELWGEDAPASSAEDLCPRFQLGEVYTTDERQMPKNWPCSWAWHDLFKEVLHLALAGEFFSEPGNFIYACCTDGMRPVFFKIERKELERSRSFGFELEINFNLLSSHLNRMSRNLQRTYTIARALRTIILTFLCPKTAFHRRNYKPRICRVTCHFGIFHEP